MVLNGIVYDFTDYAERHPGGNIIFKGAGIDGTELFSNSFNFLIFFKDKYHSWVNGAFILKGKEVGVYDYGSERGRQTKNFLGV